MIIRLKKADFSENNIGLLDTYSIKVHGTGLASEDLASTVKKDTVLTGTLTLNSGFTTSDIKVTMKGTDITSQCTISASGTTVTITTPAVTGKIEILVGEAVVEDEPSTSYNDPSLWLTQTISSGGVVSTTVTQSNIMAKEKFTEGITITALGQKLLLALVTYNTDGSFKARGSWDSIGEGATSNVITYTDSNPFNVVIATNATNTSYTVEEMLALMKITSAN